MVQLLMLKVNKVCTIMPDFNYHIICLTSICAYIILCPSSTARSTHETLHVNKNNTNQQQFNQQTSAVGQSLLPTASFDVNILGVFMNSRRQTGSQSVLCKIVLSDLMWVIFTNMSHVKISKTNGLIKMFSVKKQFRYNFCL